MLERILKKEIRARIIMDIQIVRGVKPINHSPFANNKI